MSKSPLRSLSFQLLTSSSSSRAWSSSFALALLALFGGAKVLAQPAPVLIPYTTQLIAGNPQSITGGYSGDGGLAAGTTLNAPSAIAVDSAGNIYIADSSNAVIREVNAQTGLINIIAGVPPNKCAQTSCTAVTNYADGVQATTTGIGSGVRGMAVDGFGNLIFSDTNQQVLRILYRGGTQMANLIALEDPSAAASPAAVIPGNIYLIGGATPPKPTAGTSGSTDNVLATAALFRNLSTIGLDAQNNIYILDHSNTTTRVINTQSTDQTFFGSVVHPGFVRAIVDCYGAQTVPCTSSYGIGLPPNQALVGANLTGMGVDKYGNVYEVDSNGANPIYAGVAYNKGAELAHLLALEGYQNAKTNTWYSVVNANPTTTAPAIPSALTATLANTYSTLVIRPTAINVDQLGNIYFLDNHWPALYRVDVNSQLTTRLNGTSATTGTPAAPAACSATVPTRTTDKYGDNCPVTVAILSANGGLAFDADGSVYLADSAEHLVRKLSVNNRFTNAAVGTPVVQTMQLHFDQTNLPASGATTISSPLKITSGIADYKIATAPVCTNISTAVGFAALDTSLDCYVAVTFTPSAPGLRRGVLQATTQNGATYNFTLSGTGIASELAIDGGAQQTVKLSELGRPSGIAIDALGNQYIADIQNNVIDVIPANGNAPTTIGTGLNNPQAVAVDTIGNVYVADTGNNRIVEITTSGLQIVLTTDLAANLQTGPTAIGLASPQGVAVDQYGNVFIADTGNVRIIELPADRSKSPSVLLQFNGMNGSNVKNLNTSKDSLKIPTALAVDGFGNLYIGDSGTSFVYRLPPGGGDLVNVFGLPPESASGYTPVYQSPGIYKSPSGIAVDAAGNIYVSDSATNTVTVQPSANGSGTEQYTLNFSGLSAPGGLALDNAGNLYLADSGNSRLLFMNRNNISFNYGNVPLFDPPSTTSLTVENIGNGDIKLANPAYTLTGNVGNLTVSERLNETCSGTNLVSGLTCTLNSSFLPPALGNYSEVVTVQGGAGAGGVTANLSGIGAVPRALITLVISQPPVLGGTTAAVTATLTQPHGSNTPTGTVTFAYTVNEGNTRRGGSAATVTVNSIPGTNGASTAVLNLSGLLPARRYSIVAMYNGDALDYMNVSSPLRFTAPGGTDLKVVANSVSYVYGNPVPALTGTVTGILPADVSTVTYTFVSDASPSSPVASSPYPIMLLLDGGNYLNYNLPVAVTPSGAPAVVVENPAALSVKAGNASTVYGAPAIRLPVVITGAVNGDGFPVFFSPPNTSKLNAGTYSIVPGIKGNSVGNYLVSITNAVLTVVQAPTNPATSANAAAVLPTNLGSEQVAISVSPGTSGVPTGTATLTDTFLPVNTATPLAPVTIGPINLVNGAANYTPTSPVFGTHSYTVAYSGDSNFLPSVSATPTTVIVDNPDFFVSTATSPLPILPGVIPGGNQNVPGESAATPETQTITITPVLGYTGTINLTCSSPSSYVQCSLSPSSILVSTTTAQTTVISVQTPATLPVDFKGSLRTRDAGDFRLAFVPLGLLAMIPLLRSRRRRLSRLVWLVLMGVAMGAGLSGCGNNNLVKFYTPVPSGQQPLTITASDGTLTRTIVMQIAIQ